MDLHGGHHWIMGEHFRLFTKWEVTYGVTEAMMHPAMTPIPAPSDLQNPCLNTAV